MNGNQLLAKKRLVPSRLQNVSDAKVAEKIGTERGSEGDDVFLSRSLATSTTSRSITARAVKKTGDESRTKSSNY